MLSRCIAELPDVHYGIFGMGCCSLLGVNTGVIDGWMQFYNMVKQKKKNSCETVMQLVYKSTKRSDEMMCAYKEPGSQRQYQEVIIEGRCTQKPCTCLYSVFCTRSTP